LINQFEVIILEKTFVILNKYVSKLNYCSSQSFRKGGLKFKFEINLFKIFNA